MDSEMRKHAPSRIRLCRQRIRSWHLVLQTVSLMMLCIPWNPTPCRCEAMVIESNPKRPRSSSNRGRPKAKSFKTSPSSSRRNRNSHTSKFYEHRKQQQTQGNSKITRKNRPKPPKWEKEGDDLYQDIVVDNPYRIPNEKMTHAMAVKLLLEHLPSANSALQLEDTHKDTTTEATSETVPEPPFLWGGLSVGPVWKQRLIQAGYTQPTPIQKEAFDLLTSKRKRKSNNVILAAPTGSGKSLAYLLPLLATMGSNGNKKSKKTKYNGGKVWIVTPTTELALQLQSVVSTLLGENPDESSASTVQVLKQPTAEDAETNDNSLFLKSINPDSYFLAGVPRAFRSLMAAVDDARWNGQYDPDLVERARALSDNLETVVLDEADRLLQTEAIARLEQNRRQQREQQAQQNLEGGGQASRRSSSRRSPSTRVTKPLSLDLLSSLLTHPSRRGPTPEKSLQIICASATVGRTLRKQLMKATGVTRMDAAATLVTADVRTKKDSVARKASLLPTTLRHTYHVLPDCENSQSEDAEVLTALIQLLIEESQDQVEGQNAVLVFPGRTGVEQVQTSLTQNGFKKVLGLQDVVQASSSNSVQAPTSEDTNVLARPVYVVSEKLGRGLDIPSLSSVVLLQVPSSAAGYAHLAGRAGRNGQKGTALSICRPREAPKLVRIAETLGLAMQDTGYGMEGNEDEA